MAELFINIVLMQNCVEHIVGLETLQQLEILDLADNQVWLKYPQNTHCLITNKHMLYFINFDQWLIIVCNFYSRNSPKIQICYNFCFVYR